MSITRRLFGGTAIAAAMLAGSTAHAQDDMRIALVVKALGIGFFEAAAEGAEEAAAELGNVEIIYTCLLYTSPSPRDLSTSRMPSSA